MNTHVLTKIPVICFASAMLAGQMSAISLGAESKCLPTTEVCVQAKAELLPYQNVKLSFEERAADLVSRMTIAQKAQQLGNNAPAIPELHIRQYNWWSEALHGIARDGAATSFPTGLGIAATWNPELVEQMMSAAGDEGREKFNVHANDHGLNYWSPTINLARDPRWGRAEEGYGEDPFLTSAIAVGFVKGLQGDGEDARYIKSLACAKHYMANSCEANRTLGSSDMDERAVREYYAYAFKGAAEEGKVASVMSSYNAINGTPASVNSYLLDELLRRTWGFDGFVVTDCGALDDVEIHHTWRAGDAIMMRNPEVPTWDGTLPNWDGKTWKYPQTTAAALYAGVDVNCGWVGQISMQLGAEAAVDQKLATEGMIDVSLVRLFTARMMTGEFDPAEMVPYAGEKFQAGAQIFADDHLSLAAQGADEAVVLMKNANADGSDKPLLPLQAKQMKKIVVVGHLAKEVILGDYSTNAPGHTSSPIDGITAAAKRGNADIEVVYITGSSTQHYKHLMNIRGPKAFNAEGKELWTVAFPTDKSAYDDGTHFEGPKVEAAGNLGGIRGSGARAQLGALDFSGVKKMTVEMSGEGDHMSAPTRIELRVGTPHGKLLATAVGIGDTGGWGEYKKYEFDLTGLAGGYDVMQKDVCMVMVQEKIAKDLTDEELAQIEEADAVIAYVGTNMGDSGESRDRMMLNLPGNQEKLIQAVAKINHNTIVYMQAVGQMDVENFKDDVAAMLWCTYNGQDQGNAAGRLLFGEKNPSAKLPFSWYTDVTQLDDITKYQIRSTDGKLHTPTPELSNGRTYMYFTGDLSYPFGHGLSYSQFDYSDVTLSKSSLTPDDCLTVSFDVKNSSAVDGMEVPQIYIASPKSDKIERPVKQLKGFAKKMIPAGATVKFSIDVPMESLYFWDEKEGKQVYDQGTYTLELAQSADDQKAIKMSFDLKGQLSPQVKFVKAIPTGHELVAGDASSKIETKLSAVRNDQSFVDLKADSTKVSYLSSNPEVAQVNAQGEVVGLSEGSAIITVNVQDGASEGSGSYAVVVKK